MAHKEDPVHPFLYHASDDGNEKSVLWNTNADFPVRDLIAEAHPQPIEEPSTQRASLHEVTEPVVEQDTEDVDNSTLTPFAQWLISLAPPTYMGGESISGRLRSEVASHPGDDNIAEVKKKKKKKKKGGKKKKKGQKNKAKEAMYSTALGTEVVTDTLAELTASQGYIDKAILIYRKLIDLQPEKAEHYEERIAQLKEESES